MSVVGDRKLGYSTGQTAANYVDEYEVELLLGIDYYPFGLQMDNRNHNSPEYDFGFNGKRKDDQGEWGENTHYDYGFRIYNPSIAKFLSVDPLTKSYPMLTPYQFASNSPIAGVDLDGLEFLDADESLINITSGGTYLKLENASIVTKNRAANFSTDYVSINEIGQAEIGSTFNTKINDGYSYFLREINIARNGYGGPISGRESQSTVKRTLSDGRVVDSTNPKSGGNSHQRRKERRRLERLGNKPGGGRTINGGKGKGGLIPIIVGATNDVLNTKANNLVIQDFDTALEQSKAFGKLSVTIVEKALEDGLISEEFQTDAARADLANYLLQGEFIGEYDEATRSRLESTAIKIILNDSRIDISSENIDAYDKVSPVRDSEKQNGSN